MLIAKIYDYKVIVNDKTDSKCKINFIMEQIMAKNKAVFFDRDGVINVDLSYVYKKEDFRFYDDFFPCVTHFKKQGYKLVVVTNQSGIERGYYTIKDFLSLSSYMQDYMQERLGFRFDRIYFCPLLHDTIRRKPASGMIIQAMNDLDLDLSESYLVGDRLTDIMAAKNAGITKRYLLCRDKKHENSAELDKGEYTLIHTLDDFLPDN